MSADDRSAQLLSIQAVEGSGSQGDPLERFPPEHRTTSRVTVTRHLEIAADVREPPPTRPFDVVPLSPSEGVADFIRASAQTTAAGLISLSDAARGVWREMSARGAWVSTLKSRPDAATLGGAVVAGGFALALLIAVFVPRVIDEPLALAADAAVTADDIVLVPDGPRESSGMVLPSVRPAASEVPAIPLAPGDPFRLPASVRADVAAPSRRVVASVGGPASSAPRAVGTSAQVPFVGALAIESQPSGASVFLNQQPVGETPLHLTGLTAGSRVVRIEHAGYERWTAAVLVAADKQSVVSAHLQASR